MTDYRIYRFDGGSRVVMAEWVEAGDDEDAIRQAHELSKQAAKCELWRGNHLIIALGRQDLTE